MKGNDGGKECRNIINQVERSRSFLRNICVSGNAIASISGGGISRRWIGRAFIRSADPSGLVLLFDAGLR
jgi:hypothetical protein